MTKIKHPKTFISGGSRWKVAFSSPDKERTMKARNMYKDDFYTRFKRLSNGHYAIGIKTR